MKILFNLNIFSSKFEYFNEHRIIWSILSMKDDLEDE